MNGNHRARGGKTYVEERGSAVGELKPDAESGVSPDASTLVRPEVLRTAMLPVIPQLVDHL